MTTETLLVSLAQSERAVILVLAAVPLATFAVSFVHGVYDARFAPWRHFYAAVTHLETFVFVSLAALCALLLRAGTALSELPITPLLAAAFLLSWLLAILVVKRAVDFVRLRSIRNPILLLLSWVIAWATGIYLAGIVTALIGVAPLAASAIVALPVFLLLRAVMALINRLRTR